MKGTCMTSTECVSNGGAADGNCASGFGVCCSFVVRGCGGTVAHNCTYVQNTEFPATRAGGETCKFGFNRICDRVLCLTLIGSKILTPSSHELCTESWLDFVNLVMAQPHQPGQCCTGIVQPVGISSPLLVPAGKSPPVTCGTLTGQHRYCTIQYSEDATTSGPAFDLFLDEDSALPEHPRQAKVFNYIEDRW
ncbi:hypothetical protein TCAL_14855 [Tigriopus californicus]|uniref:CUB domain-containing protein n=1 Tax=Tigriopus californicus TaxID=6832 RepID=A0A553P2G8_TIGCA|nr:hypothetical protein TCAL_14855 [Tigriopus californicus]